jgi:uncharacterized protein YyaL (SSP411 family)
MISGLSKAGSVMGDKGYINKAEQAASFVQEHLYNTGSNSLLRSCYSDSGEGIVQGLVWKTYDSYKL